MVFKSSVLSCLIPSRLGRPDSPSTRDQEKAHRPEFDPFRGNPLPLHRAADPDPCTDHSRARANTAPSGSLPPALLTPDGGIGQSPSPLHRPPVRPKRSSFTTFFAFSSKRGPTHGPPVVHFPQLQQSQSVPGRWVDSVHLINPASRTDEQYYSSTFPSHPDATNARLSLRQDLSRNPDLDSQLSSPVDSHPSHTHFRHPYAYPSPLHPRPYSKTFDTAPRLRHTTSQPFQHHPLAGSGIPPAQLGHETSKLQPELKTSMSTPNLVSGAPPLRPRSLIRKKPPSRSKGQDRWLSAESWWDALFSPSPRFKVKQAPRPNPVTDKLASGPVSKPVPGEPNRNLGVTFPSAPAARPRSISATSATLYIKPTSPALTRSRSAVDLLGQPSTSATPRAGFEPALETLVDEPTPPPEQVPESDGELSLPEPPLSLEQVLDEGEAFEQQRAQWKQQASKSLGNKHTRSFSRARSKSLGERHIRLGHHTSENSKAQFNLEFLAARTLLGSQTTMPTVHVTKQSSSSSHSKAYSHSHSQSAYSCSRSSRSRTYSHSHSHSLATSNSSKSSRHLPPRGHSRNGSWGKTALLKAVALCGIARDESYATDEMVPSSSRADVQGTVHIGHSTNAEAASDEAKVSLSPSVPSGEVGIAISSSLPPSEGSLHLDMSEPRHLERDLESRWSPKHTHKSSGYAGPHPSAIDSNLPPLGVASDVSLRHRLPPRAVIHPPIAPIAHPYRSMTARPERVGDKRNESATLKVTDGQGAMEPGTGRVPYPHISLSHADFERYGVGEALVYASLPRPKEVPGPKQADVQTESSPTAELGLQEQSPCETIVVQPEERTTSSLAISNIPSLTSSTIEMVMSAFDNPNDLDEFRDLFYKPRPASGGQHREPWVIINQVPTDVRSSTSSSPLTHLVRKLSEEVNSQRDPSRTPSDSILLHGTESQENRSNQSGSKFVFMDLTRTSSSPRPMESSSQLHVPIQEGSESAAQPVMVIPDDVNSFYTSSILENPSEDHENDTFGYPIKHGQCEAATAPTPIQSPNRLSTHLSIREDEDEENETAFLNPVTKRYGLISVDAVRASYLTTSDLSQMSGLSDFPLPPSARPVSILQAYSEAPTPPPTSESHGQSDDATELGYKNRHMDGEEDEEPSGDVEVTLRALRMTPRVTSYESRGSTYGGSDDTDPTMQLHPA